MFDQASPYRGIRSLFVAAAIVIVAWGVNQAQTVIAMMLISVFLALIGTPPVLWLQRKHVPPQLAVLIVMSGMVALLLLIGGVGGASLNTLSDALPFYQRRIQEEVLALKPFLTSKHIVVTDRVLLEYLNPGPVLGLAVGMLSGLGSALSSIALVLLTVTFILLESAGFPEKLRVALDNPRQAFSHVTKFVDDIKRYMVMKTILNLIAAVILGAWLFVLGVDFPVLWGFLAFLFHYIPNIGSVICAIPPVLLALVEYGPGSALLTAGGYLIVGFAVGNVIEPRVMGRRLGLSTLVVFLSLIVWGSLLGPVGVVLCIPLTMTLKFGCENSESMRWLAVILGPEPEVPR
jgi:AI-2 transport protein TqsA